MAKSCPHRGLPGVRLTQDYHTPAGRVHWLSRLPTNNTKADSWEPGSTASIFIFPPHVFIYKILTAGWNRTSDLTLFIRMNSTDQSYSRHVKITVHPHGCGEHAVKSRQPFTLSLFQKIMTHPRGIIYSFLLSGTSSISGFLATHSSLNALPIHI